MADKKGTEVVVVLVLVGLLAVGIFIYVSQKGKNDAITNLVKDVLDVGPKVATGVATGVVNSPLAPVGNTVNKGISTVEGALGISTGTYNWATAGAGNRLGHGDPAFYSATLKPVTASAKAYWAAQGTPVVTKNTDFQGVPGRPPAAGTTKIATATAPIGANGWRATS